MTGQPNGKEELGELFDTHFHLSFEDDLAALRQRALDAGVSRLLVAGAPVGQTAALLPRLAPHAGVYAAVGVHPHEAAAFDGKLAPYREWAAEPRVRAIGEIGLDYHYDLSPMEAQQRVFRQFLELAASLGKPAVIHCREAWDDCWAAVEQCLPSGHPVVLHCFTGTVAWLERFVARGAYISFAGILTFRNADEVRAALRATPPERLLFETDSPYLAPEPQRGRRNEPANLPWTVRRAAAELAVPAAALAARTTANGRRCFRLDELEQPAVSGTSRGRGSG